MAQRMKISDPTLQTLADYWERLRAGREAPYRSEIDPRQFEGALEHMFILEHLGDANIRVRLAGMSLCEMMGMELRGMSLRALMRVEDRAALDAALAQVLSGPSVGYIELDAHTPSGRTRRAAMVLLPLRSDFGDISRILGCLRVKDASPEDGIPLRFSIHAATIQPVQVTTTAAQATATGSLPGFGEPTPAFGHLQPVLRTIEGGAQPADPTPRRARLRLVKND